MRALWYLLVLLACTHGVAADDPKSFPQDRAQVSARELQRNIRSGRHVDLVPLPGGRIALASFQRPQLGGEMLLHIAAVNDESETLWQLAPETPGRGTSLAPAPGGELWVAGYAQGALPWDVLATSGTRGFLLRVRPDGQLRPTPPAPESMLPMLVRTDRFGNVCVIGRVRGRMEWGKKRLEGDDLGFIAILDPEGHCRHLLELRGAPIINDARVHPEGGFILAGQVKAPTRMRDRQVEPSRPDQPAGLLARVDLDGKIPWARTVESEPDATGTREREGVHALAITPGGAILTLSIQSRGTRDDLAVDRYTGAGERTLRTWIDTDVRPPGSLSIAADDERMFLTYNDGMDHGPGVPSGEHPTHLFHLVELDAKGEVRRKIVEKFPANTLVRSMVLDGDTLWLGGHFQHRLPWGEQLQKNDWIHQLFLIRQPLD